MRVTGFPAQVLYSRHAAVSVPEALILNSRTHPLRPKLLEKLATGPKDILQWGIVTDASVKVLPKNVQRTTLKAKWETAFRAALLRSGYGIDGKNLVSIKPRQGLAGRLEILITQAQGMDALSEELVDQCDKLITALEGPTQERRKGADCAVRRVGGRTA